MKPAMIIAIILVAAGVAYWSTQWLSSPPPSGRIIIDADGTVHSVATVSDTHSMEPTLNKDSLVVISPIKLADLVPSMIVIMDTAQVGLIIKRLTRAPAGHLYLKSDNPEMGDWPYRASQIRGYVSSYTTDGTEYKWTGKTYEPSG